MQGKEKRPPLHLVVVDIEKEAFGSPSTKVANLTFFIIFRYMYIFLQHVFRAFLSGNWIVGYVLNIFLMEAQIYWALQDKKIKTKKDE